MRALFPPAGSPHALRVASKRSGLIEGRLSDCLIGMRSRWQLSLVLNALIDHHRLLGELCQDLIIELVSDSSEKKDTAAFRTFTAKAGVLSFRRSLPVAQRCGSPSTVLPAPSTDGRTPTPTAGPFPPSSASAAGCRGNEPPGGVGGIGSRQPRSLNAPPCGEVVVSAAPSAGSVFPRPP